MKNNRVLKVIALALSVLLLSSCSKETAGEIIDVLFDDVVTGWFGVEGDNAENLSSLESDINLREGDDLPSKVDLTAKLPPIGNQGQYGTCVAWSVGYNLRTYMNAVDYKLSPSDLAKTENQFSPKDLFLSINNSYKGDDCNGTNFEYALDVLVERGITTLDNAPYTTLGDCSQQPNSSWKTAAADFKIDNYRKINFEDINTIKGYLDAGRVISFGARLGDKFMQSEDDEVLSAPETYNYAGQHAYHAMLLSGYDDSKNAFRVVNSWGNQWGDSGYIWVDYDFFVAEFCFCAFVAQSDRDGEEFNPDTDGDGSVDDGKQVSGYDLVAWELSDKLDPDYVEDAERERYIDYNVYNVGDKTIAKSNDWSVLYVLYNAYDANDYKILIYDYYSDDFSVVQPDDCDGDWCPENYGDIAYQPNNAGHLIGLAQNYWNYVDVAAGRSISAEGADDPGFRFYYDMPSDINGSYYMVLIADGFDVIKEEVEDNNFLYVTAEGGEPLTIQNGIVKTKIAAKRLKSGKVPQKNAASPNPTAKTENNLNTYSPTEIKAMLEHHRKTGDLDKKIKSFKDSKPRKRKVRL